MSAPKLESHCYAISLGALDVDLVNATLGTEIEPGNIYLSRKAHWHIARDHSEDYDSCMAALRRVGTLPGLIGQSPKHTSNFEAIVRFRSADPDRPFILVAIGLERDDRGSYRVKSAYSIDERAVERRRATGHLKVPRK